MSSFNGSPKPLINNDLKQAAVVRSWLLPDLSCSGLVWLSWDKGQSLHTHPPYYIPFFMLLSRRKPKSSMCQSRCFPIQQLQSLRHCRQGKRAEGSYIPCSNSPILPSFILGLLRSFFSHYTWPDLWEGFSQSFYCLLLSGVYPGLSCSQCHKLSSLMCWCCVEQRSPQGFTYSTAGDKSPYWKLVLKWKWVYGSLQ